MLFSDTRELLQYYLCLKLYSNTCILMLRMHGLKTERSEVPRIYIHTCVYTHNVCTVHKDYNVYWGGRAVKSKLILTSV